MSDTVRPHRRKPTRLPRPWDSPGKNTGVGCHFLLQCVKVKSDSEVAQSCLTLGDPMECRPTRLLHPWNFPGKNTGVGCHFLLPEETKIEKDTCIALFIAALFTIARTWAAIYGVAQSRTQLKRLSSSSSSSRTSEQISRSVVSDSLQPHESLHARPPCPSPTPGVH